MQASHRDEPTSVKSVWTNVRNNHDNYLTSTIASPMFTNLSRYPIMISKALDEVVVEIWSTTVLAAFISDGVEMCEFLARL